LRTTLFIMALAMVAACRIELDDGAYACERGRCPASWHCHSDLRCWRAPETLTQDAGDEDASTEDASVDAGIDASQVDAGDSATVALGAAIYTMCSDWSECASSLCAHGPDSTAPIGQCSRTCGDDDDCPTVAGHGGRCIAGVCLAECVEATDCPGALGCYVDPATMVHACFAVVDPAWAGTQSCSGLAQTCPAPSVCILSGGLNLEGICAVPCTASTDVCPLSADCVEVPSASPSTLDFGCMGRCSASSNGCSGSCSQYPSPESHCAPSSWEN